MLGKNGCLSDSVLLEGYFSKRFRGASNTLPNKATVMKKFAQYRNFLQHHNAECGCCISFIIFGIIPFNEWCNYGDKFSKYGGVLFGSTYADLNFSKVAMELC